MKSPKKYTAAERQAAIRRALDVGNAAASRELAIPTGTLSCWCHKARQGAAGYALPTQEPPASEDASAEAAPEGTDNASMVDSAGPAKTRVARLYTPSERARAPELAARVGVTAASKELGVSRFSLYEWRRRVKLAADGKGDCPTSGSDPGDIEAQRDRKILNIWHTHPGLGPSQVRKQLRRTGVKIGINTVRRVMEEAGYRPPKVKRDAHTERYEAVRPNHPYVAPRFLPAVHQPDQHVQPHPHRRPQPLRRRPWRR